MREPGGRAMEQGQANFISRRAALALLGAAAVVRNARAAEQAVMQPISLDHVNIRVASSPKTAQFYMGLFDTPVLRNPSLRAQPNSPPGDDFSRKFGDVSVAIPPALGREGRGLYNDSVGLSNNLRARLEGK